MGKFQGELCCRQSTHRPQATLVTKGSYMASVNGADSPGALQLEVTQPPGFQDFLSGKGWDCEKQIELRRREKL